jgi:hypothetical protein
VDDKRKVLLIGLDPAVVNYDKWPGLTAEKLEAVLRKDQASLNEIGYEASLCFIDHGERAEEIIREKLTATTYDCILIGAGVRTDPDEFILFEKAINIVHEVAPQSRICFNTGPTDSVDAVRRWA